MKHVVYHNETEKEALEYTSKLVDFGVALIVYAALNELLNAYVSLQRSKYFKHVVKKRAKNAYSMRNSKVEELKELVMHRGFAESYWDAVIDSCEDDILLLRKELEKIMKAANIEDYSLYAQAETARILLESAKVHFQEVIKDCSNKYLSKNLQQMKNLNLFEVFHEFYIDNIYKEWNNVCNELYKAIPPNIELTNDTTERVYVEMAEKFSKGYYIDKCLAVASKEFPEFADAEIKITD